MSVPKGPDDDWADLASVRRALAVAERGEPPSWLHGTFRRIDPAHIRTLLALESAERQMLFERGTWANWRQHGLNYIAYVIAHDWIREGRCADAFALLDDLVTVRYLEPETYELAIWGVHPRQTKADVDSAHARACLAAGFRSGIFRPSIYYQSLRLFAVLGDEDAALHALKCASRYDTDLAEIAADPTLSTLLAAPRFAAIMGLAASERSTILLRDRLSALPAITDQIAHSPRKVAQRALVLAAVSWRASLPGQRPFTYSAETIAEVAMMRAWLAERGLDLEKTEAALFATPLSNGMIPECIDRSWALEAAGLLGWALGRLPLPQYQHKLDAPAILAKLGLGTSDGDSLLETPTLRPAEEIQRVHRRLLTLHWRMEERRVHPGVVDLATMAESASFTGLDLGYVKLLEGDLAVSGKPVSKAKASAADRVASLTLERYRASSWLVAPERTLMSSIQTTT